MKKNNLKILFVASECTPIAKVGGLGDVIGALPKALQKLNLDVRICIPKYRIINLKKYPFKLIAKKIKTKKGFINIYQGFLPQTKVIVYLLENKKYFSQDGVYFSKTAFVGSFREIGRFLFFSQAILEIFPALNWWPQIIHCHDWHTAILPVLAKLNLNSQTQFRSAKLGGVSDLKFLLTIHNLANQGKWRPKKILDFLNLEGTEIESLRIRDKENNFNILQQGILNADLLNTVSPTYSSEILTKKYGEGLERMLLKRKKDLTGILNGIDIERFNPETDPYLKVNYSASTLEKKVENKLYLQRILNLFENKDAPLFGVVTRLTPQKGINLLLKIIPQLVRLNGQVVILGVGEKKYERDLLKHKKRYPKNVSVEIRFDPVLAQRIYGGSDFFLVPSRFEPCGLTPMIAQRYGTIPIARKTGGLVDVIEDKKTGFLFKEYSSRSLFWTINQSLAVYQQKRKWEKLIKRAMRKDFSWKKSAKKYIRLYKKLR